MRKTERKRKDYVNAQGNLSDAELTLKNENQIAATIAENIKILEEKVGLHSSFDVVFREMEFGGHKSGLFYLNGFVKEDVLTQVIMRLTYLSKEDLEPNALKKIFEQFIPHIQVVEVETMTEVVDKVLAGGTALFVEDTPNALVIDARLFPTRALEEPSTEKVVRGAKDGFIETLLTNVSLVRRRIRDPRFKTEMMKVGRRTKTDVCIAYINDIVDLQLVDDIKGKISGVQIDGIPLADKQLEEAIIKKGWNPYPMVRYSERPDVVAAHLLEGHVILFVDTSPSVIILPSTFFHHTQHAEEYRHTPFVGSYMRWVRFFGILVSLFILPLWFLFVIEPELTPKALDFIGPDKKSHLPILLQFIISEIGIDLLRMASVHTPTPLATATGLIAAILIGDVAVKTGLFVNEVLLYTAIAAVGMFATPSYELGLANRIVRLALLIAVALFKVPGLVVGTTLFLLVLIVQRSYNTPYMWPFIPFDAKAFFSLLVRLPVLSVKTRPTITKPADNTKQPEKNTN